MIYEQNITLISMETVVSGKVTTILINEIFVNFVKKKVTKILINAKKYLLTKILIYDQTCENFN